MNEETQMTADLSAGASSAKHPSHWQALPWSKIKKHVFQLQMRIAMKVARCVLRRAVAGNGHCLSDE